MCEAISSLDRWRGPYWRSARPVSSARGRLLFVRRQVKPTAPVRRPQYRKDRALVGCKRSSAVPSRRRSRARGCQGAPRRRGDRGCRPVASIFVTESVGLCQRRGGPTEVMPARARDRWCPGWRGSRLRRTGDSAKRRNRTPLRGLARPDQQNDAAGRARRAPESSSSELTRTAPAQRWALPAPILGPYELLSA
ncbi:MAG: hypothetical protein QOK16_2168 [Solirubrobacteraceae bacterium]|nr:hypothetical protein [Solirubrobacteraceae bacterium]